MDEHVFPAIGEPEWRQDATKVATFQAWADRTFPDGIRCPLCASVGVVIGNMVHDAVYPANPAFPRGRHLVSLRLQCQRCAHVMLFDANSIGLLGGF